MSDLDSTEPWHLSGGWWRLIATGVFAVLALTISSFVWYIAYRDTCSTVASWKFCQFSKHLFERALSVSVLCALLAAARPVSRRALAESSRSLQSSGSANLLALTGALFIALPLVFFGKSPTGSELLAAVTLWAAGVAALFFATLRYAAPWSAWLQFARANRLWLAAMIILGLALPEAGDTLFPLWHMDAIKDATFEAVLFVARMIGMTLTANPTEYTIGQGDFWVKVGQSCSGIEGFVLQIVFLLGYAALFRRQLAPLRVAAILPVALALSWILNVVRITLLIWIGINVSPTLAVEGFHSHAGWLVFVCLSLGIIAVIHNMDWFQRDSRPTTQQALPSFFQDWNAARILPFAVFMFTALLSSTFLADPSLAYPLRIAAVVATLWLFRAHVLDLAWRADPVALGFGSVIAIAWVALSSTDADNGAAFGPETLGSAFLFFWIVVRVLGTSLVVPLVEELFFRSYLLERLGAGRSLAASVIAVTVSTSAFALLHDKIILAAIAGAIFSWLALRPSGRIVDAIVAHMTANALIAIWAVILNDWSVI